ncbi:MAG: SMR family transporter, partial [Gammaproteobacteria bacterium]|nr:SMR family transporter [Gammaproteobacteria bacterium]
SHAIWAGLGVVLIALIGWVVFSQKLDTAAIIGISMILGGVIVLNVFSNSVTH